MSFNCLYTALVTPFNSDLTIDWESLDRLIAMQEAAGNGLLLLGSTGEGLAMPQKMKEELVSYVGKQKKRFMVGVGGHDLELQKRWIDFTLEKGADSFLLVTPYYSRPGREGQIGWFQSLMDHAKAPCMLYNIPKRAGCSIDLKALAALKQHPHLFALKEASGSLEEFRSLQKAAPEILYYVGNDDLMFELAHMGARGLVAVMSNAFPKLTRDYVTLSLKGAMNDLIAETAEAAKALSVQNPLSIKIALEKRGVIKNATPLPPLDRRDLLTLLELERALQRLDSLELKQREGAHMSASRN